jgi:alpha-tubulin suppressor-like RCC1 family protein
MVFGIKSDGTLWAWGRQAHFYTGAPNASANSSPVRVGTDSDWRACASFVQSCTVFMKRDGSLWVLDDSDHRGVANITAIVSGLVTNNQLNCIADNTTLGGDPEFGVVKSLQITFQLEGKNQIKTFTENSTVKLGVTGQSLSITRALYGDPALVRNAPETSLQYSTNQPARLRRIQLPKDVVAFCGGLHKLGAALTAEGEVWTWGEALGQHTRPIPPLQFLSKVVKPPGITGDWGDPQPVILNEPAKLENETVK